MKINFPFYIVYDIITLWLIESHNKIGGNMPQVDNPKKAKLAQLAFGQGKKFTKSVLVGSREVRRKLARQAKKKAGGK